MPSWARVAAGRVRGCPRSTTDLHQGDREPARQGQDPLQLGAPRPGGHRDVPRLVPPPRRDGPPPRPRISLGRMGTVAEIVSVVSTWPPTTSCTLPGASSPSTAARSRSDRPAIFPRRAGGRRPVRPRARARPVPGAHRHAPALGSPAFSMTSRWSRPSGLGCATPASSSTDTSPSRSRGSRESPTRTRWSTACSTAASSCSFRADRAPPRPRCARPRRESIVFISVGNPGRHRAGQEPLPPGRQRHRLQRHAGGAERQVRGDCSVSSAGRSCWTTCRTRSGPTGRSVSHRDREGRRRRSGSSSGRGGSATSTRSATS